MPVNRHWMMGHTPEKAKVERIVTLKTGNPGYLWGLNSDEPTVVGPAHKWHFRAETGISMPYWALWNGGRETGLHVFPTHESANWPALLEKMVEGLNG